MSTLKVTNIQATGETATRAVSGVAAAWVNFDGTGTVSIRNSLNTSSISDLGTGQFTQGLASSMSGGDYSSTGNAGKASGSHSESNSGYVNITEAVGTTYTAAGSKTIYVCNVSGSIVDRDHVTCTIHGDLA